MKTKFSYFSIAVLLFISNIHFLSANEQKLGGLSFFVSRVVYHESDTRGVSLTITNNSDNKYLLQSTTKPLNNESNAALLDTNSSYISPYFITSPLKEFSPGERITLNIRRVDSVALPNNKESLSFISIKAIPLIKSKEKNQAIVATVANVKLFYRPEVLTRRAIDDASSKLLFSTRNGELIIKNPTPYWIVFNTLKIDGDPIDKLQIFKMVPPLDEQSYQVVNLNNAKKIEWTLLDEDGWITKAQHSSLR